MKVLLIEDNRAFRDVVREFLEEMGASVTEAESPASALRIPLEQFKFDLIVTDVDFTDLDGFSFIDQIECTIGRHRVMFMSGTDHQKRVQQKCNTSADAVWEFARKPISRQVFRLKVGSLLAKDLR
jgi:CheY-like chemotaxis protein